MSIFNSLTGSIDDKVSVFISDTINVILKRQKNKLENKTLPASAQEILMTTFPTNW